MQTGILVRHERDRERRPQGHDLRTAGIVHGARGGVDELAVLAPGEAVVAGSDALDGEDGLAVDGLFALEDHAQVFAGDGADADHAVAGGDVEAGHGRRRGPGGAVVGRAAHDAVLVVDAVFAGVVDLQRWRGGRCETEEGLPDAWVGVVN